MTTLTIPTIFAAADRLSAPVRRMQSTVSSFARTSEVAGARMERSFRRALSPLDNFGSRFGGIGSFLGITAGIGGISLVGSAVMQYEDELANLKALTGATKAQFGTFKTQIADVAKTTKESSVDVAKAFSSIANNMPELLKNPKSLADVTSSSILLAKAARMELEPAGKAVTDILNQFGLGAEHAAKLVEQLASGSVAGSSEINDTQEALKKFGTIASNLNISTLESIAALELVSPFEKGTEAGTKMRNILLKMAKGMTNTPKAVEAMRKYGVNIGMVADNSVPFVQRLQEIAKISGDATAVMQVFDNENATLAQGLLNNAGKLDEYIGLVNTTGTATQMAATNTNTLRESLKRLKNSFETIMTTSQGASFGVNLLKNVVGFLTNNMDLLIGITVTAIGVLATWKGAILATKIATWGYKVALDALAFAQGVATVANGRYATSAFATIAGMNGMATAAFFLEASFATLALATGGIILAIGAIAVAFADGYDANVNYLEQIRKTKDGVYELPKALSKAEIALKEYNKEYSEYIKLQNFKSFLDYEKSLGGARGMLAEIKAVFTHPIMFSKAMIEQNSRNANVLVPQLSDFGLTRQQVASMTAEQQQAVNPKQAEQQSFINNYMNMSNNGKLELTVKDETGRAEITQNTGGVPINFTQTNMYNK